MIGSLRGVLLERSPDGEALVEVAGVGYRVLVTPRGLAALGELGSTVFVFTHHLVREDAQTLYGFLTRDERTCFEALLGAHGVGPALAQAILAVHGPGELRTVVAEGNLDALCLVPGIGKKTAARLVLELKDRLGVGTDIAALVASADGAHPSSPTATAAGDVRDALAALGYGADEIRGVLRDLAPSQDAAALLREALQRLGARR